MSSPAANLSGIPASPIFQRQGTALIAAGAAVVAVADAAITANSVVLVQLGLDNNALATQPGCSVCLNPGVGFSVRTTANAVAGTGLIVNWCVLKY